MSNSEELIKKIKDYFNEEEDKVNKITETFSNDVVTTAYNKIVDTLTDQIQTEDDPMILMTLVEKYVNLTDTIETKGLQRKQYLLKLFEQLVKYEQSRYY